MRSVTGKHWLTVKVRFIQDLRFDYLLDDVLQGDQSQHLVERISLPLVVHFLDDGQVGFTWKRERSAEGYNQPRAHCWTWTSTFYVLWLSTLPQTLKTSAARKVGQHQTRACEWMFANFTAAAASETSAAGLQTESASARWKHPFVFVYFGGSAASVTLPFDLSADLSWLLGGQTDALI